MRKAFLLLLFLSPIPHILACMWDTDTLAMEQQQFPDTLELITGKFIRHSPEFYTWRIEDRQKRLAENPDDVSLYDDLAVAYSKLDSNEKAIELMHRKEALKPGLYETYANLGTFHIHHGEFEKGVEYIDEAIEINPDAHFGREIYQKHLVKYVLMKRSTGVNGFPLEPKIPRGEGFMYRAAEPEEDEEVVNFYEYLLDLYNEELVEKGEKEVYSLPADDVTKAAEGVTGMMKFGNFDSPVLLEALGDLLSMDGSEDAARWLAARAYLKAGMEAKDGQSEYRRKANALMAIAKDAPRGPAAEKLERELKKEIQAGEAFYQEIRQSEIAWIEAGKNPEVEFNRKYYGIEPEPVENVDSLSTAAPDSTEIDENVEPQKAINTPSGLDYLWFVALAIVVGGGGIFWVNKLRNRGRR